MYRNDERIVVTLDAGGTNFVFCAMQGCKYIIEPITKHSNAHNLSLCLQTMVDGFTEVMKQTSGKAVAISFAFPGPADYPNGIIGGYLPNFPSFRDGVALGPYLAKKFGVPVFINNDGDLFTYGEALCGILPDINERLQRMGCHKQYRNLLGYTFGTGFGIGSVIEGRLNRGNNSCVETFCLRHKMHPDWFAEEGVAVRALQRVYAEMSGNPNHGLQPKDMADVIEGRRDGDKAAALEAFRQYGEVAGDAMATAMTLTDSLIVIGGGITHNSKYIWPALLGEMRCKLRSAGGDEINRMQMEVFNLDNEAEFERFARGAARKIKVFGSDDEVVYDPMKCSGIAKSKLGASKAIAIGAYAFALANL